jgi:pyruvate kinase
MSWALRAALLLSTGAAAGATLLGTNATLRLERAFDALTALRADCLTAESEFRADIDAAAPAYRDSALNLVHYLALRRHDMRPLQDSLHDIGLSSLGAAESHVLPSLDAVLSLIGAVLGTAPLGTLDAAHPAASPPHRHVSAFDSGRERLAAHAVAALGPSPARHATRIMVTMPSEAAHDPAVAAELVNGGMTLARINCAHDGPEEWANMVANIRAADAAASRRLAEAERRVPDGAVATSSSSSHTPHQQQQRPRTLLSFDLAGPKLRTGPVVSGPAVLSWHPPRDARGVRTAVARLLLSLAPPPSAARCAADALCTGSTWVPLGRGGRALVDAAEPGDVLLLHDLRNRSSRLTVLALAPGRDGLLAAASSTAYVEEGCALGLLRHGSGGGGVGRDGGDKAHTAHIGAIPPPPGSLRLAIGDAVRFVRGQTPSHGPANGTGAAVVSIDVPAVFEHVAVGHRVLLDDGKFGGVVESVERDRSAFSAVLTTVQGGASKLGAEKGISECAVEARAGACWAGGRALESIAEAATPLSAFRRPYDSLHTVFGATATATADLPDTDLGLPALGEEDRMALAAALALSPDLVALSFVQGAPDVAALQEALDAAGAAGVGIVLKVETSAGFANLPSLILQGLRRPAPFALMLARGDLGVEVGFARMSEVQQELLWLAEAAHVPVIWATQVLESLAKTGVPSRGDVTDAASSGLAEAVMLNKGPFMPQVLAFLQDVLARTSAHEVKRRHMLRRLGVAARAFEQRRLRDGSGQDDVASGQPPSALLAEAHAGGGNGGGHPALRSAAHTSETAAPSMPALDGAAARTAAAPRNVEVLVGGGV